MENTSLELNETNLSLDESLFNKNDQIRCKYNYKNGNFYQGDMKLVKNNKINNLIKHGKGLMVYTNGDKYIGEWKNDKKDGRGILTSKKGSTFDASWSNDEMLGTREIQKNEFNCKYIYKNGDIYYGKMKFLGQNQNLFENFILLRHGKGILVENNGNVFNGTWQNNKKHGIGIAYLMNGDNLIENWNDGQKLEKF